MNVYLLIVRVCDLIFPVAAYQPNVVEELPPIPDWATAPRCPDFISVDSNGELREEWVA